MATVVALLTVLLSALLVAAQHPGAGTCQGKPSQELQGYTDFHCNCGEQIPQIARNVNVVTIDKTQCPHFTAINFSWDSIETNYGRPRSITIVGAEVVIDKPLVTSRNSTLTKIEFQSCTLQSLTTRAFSGVHLLEHLIFIDTEIVKVDAYAISNLPTLKFIEFSQCDIGVISENAISGLPTLFDLSFVKCNINTLMHNAVHILKTSNKSSSDHCPSVNVLSGANENSNNMEEMTTSIDNSEEIRLPKFGSRLIIYKNTIQKIENSAIESDLFSYLIIGGNHIQYLSQKAFNVQLSNSCDNSVFVVASNTLNHVEPEAMAYVSGRSTTTHKTLMVITQNVFEYVGQKGVYLHPTIDVHDNSHNVFFCNCSNFQWTLLSATTPRQQTFEKDLREKSQCQDKATPVSTFLSTCSEEDIGVHGGHGHAYASDGSRTLLHLWTLVAVVVTVILLMK